MNDISYDNNQGLYFRLCNVCNKRIYNKYKSQIKQKTCSHSCQLKGNKYNVGKKPINAFVKGENTGDKNINWKGDNVGYDAVHDWIRRNYGSPQICENCDAINLGNKKHQWANISGKYKRDRNDWKRLCAKCHYYYDNRDKILSRYQKLPIKHSSKKNKSQSGYKNVRVTKSGSYSPYISIEGKQKRLGTYKTAQEAYEVYRSKALELYGIY